MKVKKIKNAISLNGEIDKNYQFTPGVGPVLRTRVFGTSES